MPNSALFFDDWRSQLVFMCRTRPGEGVKIWLKKGAKNKNKEKAAVETPCPPLIRQLISKWQTKTVTNSFWRKNLTLTTDKDNLFMEEVERVAYEKYKIIKKQMKNADNETIAILMAINSLSTQWNVKFKLKIWKKKLEILRAKQHRTT